MQRSLKLIVMGFVIASAAAMTPATQAQSAAQGAPPAKPDQIQPDVLAGPKVEPEATEQRSAAGRPNANNADQRREGEIPLERWIGALRGLGLSQEQQDQVRTITAEHRQAMREFQAEHGDQLRTLFAQAREARQAQTEPPEGLREKIRAIEDQRPKLDPVKERIWAVLNDQQQAQMKESLEAIRKELLENRNQRRENRPGDDTRPRRGPGAADRPAPSPDAGDPMHGPPPPAGEMMSPPPDDEPMNRPNARGKRPTQASALDERSRRRVEFLRSHQSSRRAGAGPTDAQRRFKFDDPQESQTPWESPGQADSE